jgi:hypothetical protein
MRPTLLPALAVVLLPALSPSVAAGGCGYDSMLAGDGVRVQVAVPAKEPCAVGTYSVTFSRKGAPPQVVKLKRDGTVSNVFFEDVTGDDKRDLVVFFTSAGSGAYGRLDIWEWRGDRFKGGIVSDLMPDQRSGYGGHDVFTAAAGVLRRRFPLYREGDANCCPSGGTVAFRWDAKTNVWVRE